MKNLSPLYLSLSLFLSTAAFATDTGDDGVYKTLENITAEQCHQACELEATTTCRGLEFQTTGSSITGVCKLNNGQGENSLFKAETPEPLDLTQALSDLNEYRKSYGLNKVKLNGILSDASQIHADDMAQTGILSHTGSDDSSPADRAARVDYEFWALYENVAGGQNSWEEAFQAWKDSPPHNRALLADNVTEFGIALAFNPKTRMASFWSMLVATPQKDKAKLIKTKTRRRY